MARQGDMVLPSGGKAVVVSDSTSSLTPEMGRHYGIRIVPAYVNFGNQTYRDGVELDAGLFYRLLAESDRLPTTAQPAVADFVQVYAELWKQAEPQGAEGIISVHPSIEMTATVDAARAASKELPGVPVHVIDTRTISMGLGLIAIAAGRAAAAGQDVRSIIGLVEDLIPRVRVVFTVETMEYLRKGGRIGRATALVGTLLNIKPVLQIKDGHVEPLEKPRTRKKAIGCMLDWMVDQVGSSRLVQAAVLHCDAHDDAQALVGQVEQRFPGMELFAAEAGPTIGTHGGPGTVGIVFYSE